jgi:DNA-binding NtrC family response regulator
LDDLGSGGSLCDRGDARDHQMRIVGALRPLAYTEPAIDLVCTLRAVHALQGNLTHSARYIGITRAALDRLISRYGLERLRGGVYGDCLL